MSSQKAIDRYVQALVSPDRNIRRKAVVGLVESGSIRAIPILERVAAEDSDAELQFLAKKGLSLIKAKLEFSEVISTKVKVGERAVPTADLAALDSHLDSPDASMRARVVKASVATRDPRILEVLIPHLENETDETVKGLVLLAVGILGNKNHLSVLTNNIKASEAAMRKAAVEALGAMNKPFALPFLVETLNDREANVRNTAFALLRRLGKDNILKLLQTMLSAPKGWMKGSALRACARFNSPEIVDMLEPHASADDADHRRLARRALKMLAKAGNARAEAILRELIAASAAQTDQTQPAETMQPAAPSDEPGPEDSQVGEAPIPVELSPAAVDLASADTRKRQKFLQDAILHNDASVLPDIIKRLPAEPDAKVRASMLITLGRLGGPSELDIIIPYLDDSEDRLRASAVEAISLIPSADFEKLFVPRLADKDNRTRANAIVALKDHEQVDLIGPLRELAESVRIRDRLSAIYAITHLDTAAAVEILDALSTDQSRVVAKRAKEAQQIVTGKKGPASRRRGNTGASKASKRKSKSTPSPATTSTTDDVAEAATATTAAEAKVSSPPAPTEATETNDGGTEPAPDEQDERQTKPVEKKARKTEKATRRPRSRPDTRDATKRKTGARKKPSPAGSTSTDKSTATKTSIPQGILLHGASDLLLAIGLGGLGLWLLATQGPPNDEVVLPFCVIFLVAPAVFLIGGMGLLLGKPWGRHVNGCILHVLRIPVLAPMCLAYLLTKESLVFLGMEKPSFPVKLYYGVAGGGVIFMFLLLSMIQ